VTKIVGIGLLASAFAPLLALLAILKLSEHRWISLSVLVGCVAAVTLLALVLRSLKTVQPRSIDSVSVRRADERVLSFAASYVVPPILVFVGGSALPTVVATVALVLLLAVIYIRAGLYHLNPTLAVYGFRLYEVTADNGSVTLLLTRDSYIAQRGTLVCRYLGDDVAIQLEGERDR